MECNADLSKDGNQDMKRHNNPKNQAFKQTELNPIREKQAVFGMKNYPFRGNILLRMLPLFVRMLPQMLCPNSLYYKELSARGNILTFISIDHIKQANQAVRQNIYALYTLIQGCYRDFNVTFVTFNVNSLHYKDLHGNIRLFWNVSGMLPRFKSWEAQNA